MTTGAQQHWRPEPFLNLERWQEAWIDLGAAVTPDAVHGELLTRYTEPHRHYHTLQHLAECLSWLEQAGHLATRLPEVQVALWFHDAIYDVRASDNEARSAALAVETARAAGVAIDALTRIETLIMATKHDAAPLDPDAQLLVDIDLAILGADEPRYAEYETQVRAEYAWVPRWIFRRKRREILQGFLARPAIYSTPFFRERLEIAARRNLSRAITNLGG